MATTPGRSSAASSPGSSRRFSRNVRSLEPDVAGIVGKLTQGAVDAGFVYVTDVVATDGALEAVELPPPLAPEVAYGAVVVEGAENPERAESFIDGLLEGRGRRRAGRRRLRPASEVTGTRRRPGAFAVLLVLALAVALLFLVLPIVAIFIDTGPGELIDSLGQAESRDALLLSLETTLAALLDHRRRRHARRVPARDTRVPRAGGWR